MWADVGMTGCASVPEARSLARSSKPTREETKDNTTRLHVDMPAPNPKPPEPQTECLRPLEALGCRRSGRGGTFDLGLAV